MVASSRQSKRVEKLTPRRRKLFLGNACIEDESESHPAMANQNPDEDGEVFVVLTKEERGTINFIQRRDPKQKPAINWAKTAEKIGMQEYYLRALCRIHLPPNSNDIPQSSINKALRSLYE